MKASRTILAAAGLILAAGPAVFGSSGAAAGLRPPVSPPPAVSVWRGDDHRAIEGGRRRAGRDHRNRLDLFGAAGPTESQTPAGEEEEAAASRDLLSAGAPRSAASRRSRRGRGSSRSASARRGAAPCRSSSTAISRDSAGRRARA